MAKSSSKFHSPAPEKKREIETESRLLLPLTLNACAQANRKTTGKFAHVAQYNYTLLYYLLS